MPTRSSATGSMPWRRRSSRANRCGSISRCASSRAASRTRDRSLGRRERHLLHERRVAARHRLSGGPRTARCRPIDARMDSPRAPMVPSLDDLEARHDAGRAVRIAFEAVVGTDDGQVAVAPGRLRRTWTEDGRRYFHYATDAPIRNDYAFFSAAYAVHEGRWNDPSIRLAGQGTSIEIVHHPEARVERGAHGPKRTGVAGLLHEGVRPVPARPGQARRASRRRGQLARLSDQHLVRGRVLSVESRQRSAEHRFSVRRRGA